MSAVHDLPLRHYSDRPVVLDRTHRYHSSIRRFDKPLGFWVSVKGEYDWPEFCDSEGFKHERLAVEHEVRLAPQANILLIDSPGKMLSFSQEYGMQVFPSEKRNSIEWERLYAEYDGIIIAPYQWQFRHSMIWYYSWDVASGCIWNLDMIEAVEPTGVDVLQEVRARA